MQRWTVMHTSKEFKNFDRAMQKLLKVPHAEIKKKLDEEKEAKRKQDNFVHESLVTQSLMGT